MEKWETIQQGPFEPTWDSLRTYQCPDWFRDAKFGVWSHWGPQSVPMYGDWYARNMYREGTDQYLHHWRVYGHPSKHGWKDVVQLWKAEKFDPESKYIKKWIPEFETPQYPDPIIDHKKARERAIETYKAVVSKK